MTHESLHLTDLRRRRLSFPSADHVFIVDRLTCPQNLWTLGKDGGLELRLGAETASSLVCRQTFQDSVPHASSYFLEAQVVNHLSLNASRKVKALPNVQL